MQLKELEQKVLALLGGGDSENVLSNDPLIETLALSQKTSKEIMERVVESAAVERAIDRTRLEYVPVARRGAALYFCV